MGEKRERLSVLVRAQWKHFCHMTSRKTDHRLPGSDMSLQLGMVGLWDLTALLTQQCHISTPIMLVYSAALLNPV